MPGQIKIVAHRGFSSRAPENTCAAIRQALDFGVDMIELDVAQSADGIPVLFHDLSLERTTGYKAPVRKLSFKSLRNMDAGKWFSGQFRNEKIPSLEEAITLVDGKCILLLELKKGDRYFPDILKHTGEIIMKHDAGPWCIVQSFDPAILKKFRSLFPDIRLHKLVTGNIPGMPLHLDNRLRLGRITKYDEVESINVNFRMLNRRKVKRIRQRGQEVFAWTVNNKSDMQKLIRMGVSGIITDYPDRLKEVLSSK